MAHIGITALSRMLHRVGASFRAGLDMLKIWDNEALRGSPTYRSQAAKVSERIRNGDTLAEALSSCGGFFPPLVCDLVDVGERTGKLDEVLTGLAGHYDHLISLRRSFLMAIAWPVIELSFAVLIVTGLIWIMGALAPGTRILGFSGASGAVTFLSLVGLTVGGLVVLVLGTLRGWFGTRPLRVALRIPILGKCLQTMAMARFTWCMALALDTGMDARQSVRLALRSTQLPNFVEAIPVVDEAVLSGQEFHTALGRSGEFPDDFLDALATAEVSGTHADSLYRLAAEYRQRAESASRTLTYLASALIALVCVAFIVTIIFQIFLTQILAPYKEAMDFMDEAY